MSHLLRVSLLLSLSAVAALRQVETWQVSGEVTYPQYGVVPGATVVDEIVKAESIEIGAERRITTIDRAAFVLTKLKPGFYYITVD
ncbi:MAG: carboxypeptidase-like regulatory domain-containing protein [Blastocatellia bacterium]|nr:carboxypeptidase-like regulatory domain-containing protein [Blastocatellia bacterium]